MEGLCIWTLEEWHDYWETACGQAFCMTTGTPHENTYNYCPYCGRGLIERWPEQELFDGE